MRIITPTGKVHKVYNVVPYVEKKEVFNGTIHVTTEVAVNMSVKPTGIKLSLKKEPDDFGLQLVYIGNLTPEKVQEILGSLLKLGYYDFTQFDYQKVDNIMFSKMIEIDGGKTLPYYKEIINLNDIYSPFEGRYLASEEELEDFYEGDEYEE